MKELIFATGNNHKVQEVKEVIEKEKYSIQSLSDIGVFDDIQETGSTLEENALIKARFISNLGYPNVFSEDSGLEVTALNGAPGILTARYGGPEKDANQNMDLLLKNLESVQDRSAQFRAIIALILDGQAVLFEGIIKGKIAHIKSGVEGFGYDPIFIPKGHDKPFAELPNSVKLEISHRTRALNKMIKFLTSI